MTSKLLATIVILTLLTVAATQSISLQISTGGRRGFIPAERSCHSEVYKRCKYPNHDPSQWITSRPPDVKPCCDIPYFFCHEEFGVCVYNPPFIGGLDIASNGEPAGTDHPEGSDEDTRQFLELLKELEAASADDGSSSTSAP